MSSGASYNVREIVIGTGGTADQAATCVRIGGTLGAPLGPALEARTPAL